jgi:hypothetical protein
MGDIYEHAAMMIRPTHEKVLYEVWVVIQTNMFI